MYSAVIFNSKLDYCYTVCWEVFIGYLGVTFSASFTSFISTFGASLNCVIIIIRMCIILVWSRSTTLCNWCWNHRVIWVWGGNEIWSCFQSGFYLWAGDSLLSQYYTVLICQVKRLGRRRILTPESSEKILSSKKELNSQLLVRLDALTTELLEPLWQAGSKFNYTM